MGWCLFQYWKSITFASALLADESSESFIWACEAFKKKLKLRQGVLSQTNVEQ